MLGHRHQLDVGEAEVRHIGHQLGRQLVIGQEAPIRPFPRSKMHFIGGHRRAAVVAAGSALHPRAVAPDKRLAMRHDRGGAGPQLAGKAERVGLEWQQFAVRSQNLEFVERVRPDTGRKNLPHAAVNALAHGVAATIPGIEIADNGHARRVRSPDGEMRAGDALARHRMRAKLVEQPVMRAFNQQVIVLVAEHTGKGVGVVKGPAALAVCGPQAVGEAVLAPGGRAFKKTVLVAAPKTGDQRSVSPDSLNSLGTRHQRPDNIGPARFVQAQHCKRVAMRRGQNGVNRGLCCLPGRPRHTPYTSGNGTSQISPAYSRMVRSDENQPVRAVLSMLF